MGYTVAQILDRCLKSGNAKRENEKARERFEKLLLDTKREGIEEVLDFLDGTDFFIAPASCANHNGMKGGLLEHSLNVYEEAMALREKQIQMNPAIENLLPQESIAIASLLHDVCKIGQYKKNIRTSIFVFSTQGREYKYRCDYSSFPIGHGEKSVILLLMAGLKMTKDEMLAIRWHMAPWDLPFQSQDIIQNVNTARRDSPLVVLVSTADTLAARILEGKLGG